MANGGHSVCLQVYKQIEDGARNVIMALGGSISHHHGAGKLRREFLPNAVGETSRPALSSLSRKHRCLTAHLSCALLQAANPGMLE